ncbi:MAG TPA: RDD family protein [Solirubrobacteraceae bacterium]|nr:RDD family protein [Solirubrobacteraceae bacterium]
MEYEDRVAIAAPGGREVDLPLAGQGSRGAALVLDYAFKGAAAVVVLLVAAGLGAIGLPLLGDPAGVVAVALAALGLLFAYDVLFEVLAGGRTPGKRALAVRVVAGDGAPVGWRASAVRNLVRVLEGPLTLYTVAFVASSASPRNQRLGDRAAGTLVVREPAPASPAGAGAPAAFAPPVAPTPSADLGAVSAGELAVVRRFLERRGALAPDPRAQVARELADRLRPRIGGAPPGGTDEGFLEWLAAEKAARGA